MPDKCLTIAWNMLTNGYQSRVLRSAGSICYACYHRLLGKREWLQPGISPGINGFVSTSSSSFTMERVPCLYFWKCGVFRWLS